MFLKLFSNLNNNINSKLMELKERENSGLFRRKRP